MAHQLLNNKHIDTPFLHFISYKVEFVNHIYSS